MAPPDRSDTPADTAVLDQAGITKNSRLRPNAERLTSWIEWLLQPDQHSYDRTVIYPDGTKREEPGPVAEINDQPGTLPSDATLPFESVIEGFQPWQFLHGMAAVAKPVVESPGSPLAQSAAALHNLWWVGDRSIPSLVDQFPTIGWTGEAADAAFGFLLRLQTVADQVTKFVDKLYGVVPKYAAIIKGVRDNLDEAAAGVVEAFEVKFASKPESGFSVDIAAAILAGVAAAAVTFVSPPAGGLILDAFVTSAWATLFTDVAGDTLEQVTGTVGGYWWRDLVDSYLHEQALILTAARDEIDQLNRSITGLVNLLTNDPEIKRFIEDYVS